MSYLYKILDIQNVFISNEILTIEDVVYCKWRKVTNRFIHHHIDFFRNNGKIAIQSDHCA